VRFSASREANLHAVESSTDASESASIVTSQTRNSVQHQSPCPFSWLFYSLCRRLHKKTHERTSQREGTSLGESCYRNSAPPSARESRKSRSDLGIGAAG
jgi:hypothetical protein